MSTPEYQRGWRAKNREHTRAYMREYLAKRRREKPSLVKREYERSVDRIKETRRLRREADPARARERESARNRKPVRAAKAILAKLTGVPTRDIPMNLVEAKAAQLEVTRLARQIKRRTANLPDGE